jgi:hypothetical protein
MMMERRQEKKWEMKGLKKNLVLNFHVHSSSLVVVLELVMNTNVVLTCGYAKFHHQNILWSLLLIVWSYPCFISRACVHLK